MLERLLVKDYEDTGNPRVRNAYGVLTSIVGIVFNLILSITKIVLGVLAGAVSVLADGLNNLSDAGTSLVTLFGFRIANKPADSTHPFGHARVEYVSSMIISFVVLFLGLELTLSSIEKLVKGGETSVDIVLMSVLGASILVKIGLAIYYRHMAKKIDSTAIRAMSIDSMSDIFATSAVLISMIVMYYTEVELDGYIGIVVALFILIGGAKLFKDTLSPILGEAPNREFVEHVATKVKSYDGVLGIHDLIAHNYGENRYYASLHVEVSASSGLVESHDLIDRIERDFKAEGYNIVIHLDPVVTDDVRVDTLETMVKGVLTDIDPSITMHDFRAMFSNGKKKLIFDIVLPEYSKDDDKEIVSLISDKIREIDSECSIVVNVDRNYIRV